MIDNLNRKLILLIKIFAGLTLVIGFWADLGGSYAFFEDFAKFLNIYIGYPMSQSAVAVLMILSVALCYLIFEFFNKAATSIRQSQYDEQKVRKSYLRWIRNEIENRRKSSIHHAHYIDLNLIESQSSVFPWTYVYHDSITQTDKIIDSIKELVGASIFRILLLGAPGGGKTTTLLDCLLNSIEKAENDQSANVPIFINLAHWNQNKTHLYDFDTDASSEHSSLKKDSTVNALSFRDWIIKMTIALKGAGLKYQVVEQWLNDERVSLFFDGLDEIEESLRGPMVNEINTLLKENGLLSIIVCSRSIDYEALVNTTNIKLRLETALTIQPLTSQQINNYLEAAKKTELIPFLNEDAELYEMAKSPLDLSIMVLACSYSDFGKVVSVQTNSRVEKRFALFDAYVKAMMEREYLRKKKNPFAPESDLLRLNIISEQKITRLYKYLGWIARLLSERSIPSFSTKQLYNYYRDEKSDSFLICKNIAGGLVLLIVTAFFSTGFVYKEQGNYLVFMLTVLLAILFTGLYLFRQINKNLITNAETSYGPDGPEDIFIYIIVSIPIISIIIPLLYLAISFLFFSWDYGIWCFYALYATGLFVLFNSKTKKKFTFPSPSYFVLILLPLLGIIYIKDGYINQYIYLYVVTAFINSALLINDEISFRKDTNNIIRCNLLHILTAAISLYLFSGHAASLFILALQAGMIIGIILFIYESDHIGVPLFLGSFFGLITGFFIPVPITFLLSIFFFFTVQKFFGRRAEELISIIFSFIILILIKTKNELPIRFSYFLNYSTRTLLLKRNSSGYEFIHRRIRDYFATIELIPSLQTPSISNRVKLIHRLSKLNDASCEVILELIDDPDKEVRKACILGLGKIGSAIAATALLKAEKRTSGELNYLILEQIKLIRDIGALPILFNILNTEPVDSRLFNAALYAINKDPAILMDWANQEKIQEYLDLPNADLKLKENLPYLIDHIEERKLRLIYSQNKGITEGIFDEDIRIKAILTQIPKMSETELIALLADNDNIIGEEAFYRLSKKNIKLAASASVSLITDFESYKFRNILEAKRFNKRRIIKELRKILSQHDQVTTNGTLLMLLELNDPELEIYITKLPENLREMFAYDLLSEIVKKPTYKSVLFLLQCLKSKNQKQVDAADEMLSRIASRKCANKFLLFIKENPGHPNINTLISFLTYQKNRKLVPLLQELLNSDQTETKKRAIIAIGQFKVKSAIPSLLTLLYKKEVNILGSVLLTLEHLEVNYDQDFLLDLYKRHNFLRLYILWLYIKQNNKSLIWEACKISTTEDEKDELLLLYFALYFASSSETDILINMLFVLPLDLKNNDRWTWGVGYDFDLLIQEPLLKKLLQTCSSLGTSSYKKNNKLSISSIKHLQYRLAPENRNLSMNSRKKVYDMIEIEDENYALLETISFYSISLAKEFASYIFTHPNSNLRTTIAQKIANSTNKQEQILLITIGAAYNIRDIIPLLYTLLDQKEEEIICKILPALAFLQDISSFERVLEYFKSTNPSILKQTFLAIISMQKFEYREIHLSKFIFSNISLAVSLTNKKYLYLLEQLSTADMNTMRINTNPNYRYLAAIYMGIVGHGSSIDNLAELLNDETLINIVSKKKHQSVSHGALYALNLIGTPSAKEVIAEWKKNKI